MRKLFSFLLTLILLVILLLVAGGVIVALYFDPNDFKTQLADAVKEKTGRELSIGGNIGLSVFPWLAVEVDEVALGNAPGFAEPVFAGADRVRIRVKLLPLLRKEVEMDTVTLRGLTVNLARDAAGQTNWQDLVEREEEPQGTAPSEPEAEKGGLPIAALAVGGVDIEGARVQWHDAQADQRYEVDDFRLKTGAIKPGEPVEVDMGFKVKGDKPDIEGQVSLATIVELDLERQVYRARDLSLDLQVAGEPVPVERLILALKAEAEVDLSRQTLALSGLVVDTLGMQATGEINATGIVDAPEYKGRLDIAEFSPKELVERLGLPPVATTDPGVLSKAMLATRLSGTAKAISLNPVTLRLDETTIEGEFSVPDFDGPALRFDLLVDAIDADRYMPPPVAATPGQAPSGESPAPAQQGVPAAPPLEALRKLDADGRLRIGKLKVNNLRINDVLVKFNGKDGRLRVDPLSAQLYEGSLRGNATLDARGKQPKLAVKQTLSNIQAGPLLRDLAGEERLLGTAQLDADISLAGMDPDTVKRNLNGRVEFGFFEGAVKGINIGRLLREAKARLSGTALPPERAEVRTDFSELTGTLELTNGKVRNDDLAAKSPLLRVKGKGDVDLVGEGIDYLLTVTLVDTLAGQGGKDLEALKGVPIPVKIGGTFDKPSFRPDLGEVLKSKATEEIKKKAEAEVKKKIEEELAPQIQDKVGDKAQDLLKGLFR